MRSSVRFVKKEAGGSEIYRCNNILLSRNKFFFIRDLFLDYMRV